MYTMKEVTDILGVHSATIQRWEKLGYVQLSKKTREYIGGKWLRMFSEQDLQTLRDYKDK